MGCMRIIIHSIYSLHMMVCIRGNVLWEFYLLTIFKEQWRASKFTYELDIPLWIHENVSKLFLFTWRIISFIFFCKIYRYQNNDLFDVAVTTLINSFFKYLIEAFDSSIHNTHPPLRRWPSHKLLIDSWGIFAGT